MPKERRTLTPGAVVHITSNTLCQRYAFTPKAKFTRRARGIIRKYQKIYRMKICVVVVLSTHYHMQLIPESQTQLSDFLRDVNASLARLVQNLYGIEGPILIGPFEQSEALDDEAVMKDFAYILSNATKENLVADPRHWPGIHSAAELCGGRAEVGEWFDGDAYEAARKRNPYVSAALFWIREPIELTPIPQHQGLTRHQRQTAVRRMVQKIVRDCEATRTRPVKGAAAVVAQDPRYIPPPPPRTSREASPNVGDPAGGRDQPNSSGSSAKPERTGRLPRFKAGGPNAQALLKAAETARKAANEAYDRAMDAFIEGRRDVPFPESCYLPLLVRRALAAP